METTPRGRWFVDGFLVAMYVVLVAVAVPELRPHTEMEYFRNGIPSPVVGWEIPPGTTRYTRVYGGDNWTRSLPMLLTVLLLPMLRRRPLVAAFSLALAELAVGTANAAGDARYVLFVAADLVVMDIALHAPRRTSLKAAAFVLSGALAGTIVAPPGASSLLGTHLIVILLLTTVAWLIGNSVRERRAGAARQRADAAAQAVSNERLRIARELHDMIAHSIGIIAIQAGMGNRVIATQPGEARKALQAIEETSRDTLSQLRRTLTALRQGDVAGTPTDPAPGLADLDKLVASTQRAGVLAIVETGGLPRPLPGEVDLAAYRIIQESVTNVVRHSGARTCHVTVEYGEGAVTITVADDGHGVLGSGGTGFGLVGMRERVSLVHGEFSAGPRPGGGFLVRAKLPVPGFGTVFGGPGADPGPNPDPENPESADAPQDPDSDPSVRDASAAPSAPDQNPAVTS
ncbi:sensor histidine kinase [Catenulispora subtropica]|uniref:sensor histidine kinase n=1 Tax=Catenulispora subtropica TaxID=450798 RepID=UPI0031D12C71